jgi:hypothetical protein
MPLPLRDVEEEDRHRAGPGPEGVDLVGASDALVLVVDPLRAPGIGASAELPVAARNGGGRQGGEDLLDGPARLRAELHAQDGLGRRVRSGEDEAVVRLEAVLEDAHGRCVEEPSEGARRGVFFAHGHEPGMPARERPPDLVPSSVRKETRESRLHRSGSRRDTGSGRNPNLELGTTAPWPSGASPREGRRRARGSASGTSWSVWRERRSPRRPICSGRSTPTRSDAICGSRSSAAGIAWS